MDDFAEDWEALPKVAPKPGRAEDFGNDWESLREVPAVAWAQLVDEFGELIENTLIRCPDNFWSAPKHTLEWDREKTGYVGELRTVSAMRIFRRPWDNHHSQEIKLDKPAEFWGYITLTYERRASYYTNNLGFIVVPAGTSTTTTMNPITFYTGSSATIGTFTIQLGPNYSWI